MGSNHPTDDDGDDRNRRRNERVGTWLRGGPYEVLRVRADNVGGLKLELACDYALDVFPDDSRDDEYSEHWRLLRPGSHFVVSGCGIFGLGASVHPGASCGVSTLASAVV